MNITSTGQNVSYSGQTSNQVNLSNISINEISTLVKSGMNVLLDVVPFIPPNMLGQYNYDPESIGEHRVNLLGQAETGIQFKKSIGMETAHL